MKNNIQISINCNVLNSRKQYLANGVWVAVEVDGFYSEQI